MSISTQFTIKPVHSSNKLYNNDDLSSDDENNPTVATTIRLCDKSPAQQTVYDPSETTTVTIHPAHLSTPLATSDNKTRTDKVILDKVSGSIDNADDDNDDDSCDDIISDVSVSLSAKLISHITTPKVTNSSNSKAFENSAQDDANVSASLVLVNKKIPVSAGSNAISATSSSCYYCEFFNNFSLDDHHALLRSFP
ncbi:unnamed protein product [Anisakis simplex]|uniref:Uncharacterized protein n=1 Tax=Anisakis simplex TaxID=6269 RepID=A0A0M3J9D9_ANISI|nr:unnamed protein product [Anisakis simplex]